MSSPTSQKTKDLVPESIDLKPVTVLPGIGEAHGNSLIEEGFPMAFNVLLKFLVDKDGFKTWLKSKTTADSSHTEKCYEGLKNWCDKNFYRRKTGDGNETLQPQERFRIISDIWEEMDAMFQETKTDIDTLKNQVKKEEQEDAELQSSSDTAEDEAAGEDEAKASAQGKREVKPANLKQLEYDVLLAKKEKLNAQTTYYMWMNKKFEKEEQEEKPSCDAELPSSSDTAEDEAAGEDETKASAQGKKEVKPDDLKQLKYEAHPAQKEN